MRARLPLSGPAGPLRLAVFLVGASAVLATGSSVALQVRQVTEDRTDIRNGVVQPAPAVAKVFSPGLPGQNSSSFSISATATEGTAGASSAANLVSSTYDVLASPGDGPGATLCVSYRYHSSVTGVVTTASGSAAGGTGSQVGYTVSASASPAVVTFPNPLTLVVTPAVGPDRLIFSDSSSMFTTSTSSTVPSSQSGKFFVQAGDTIKLDMALAGAARGEPDTGVASVTGSQQLSLGVCDAASVPALSTPMTGLLAALMALVAGLAAGVPLSRRRRR